MEIQKISGVEDIKKIFESTLDNDEKILRTALSDKPLVYLAGNEFADYYMNKRLKAEIFLKSLRFTKDNVDNSNHKNYSDFNKEARVASGDDKIDSSIVIWDDNVAIIDTKTISGTITKDIDNATKMKEWFDSIWDKSS